MEGQKIQVNVDPGKETFFSDGVVVSHNQSKFTLDFRQTTPRFNQLPGQDEPNMMFALCHNSIMMDPVLVKDFANSLTENIQKYEEKFGEIKIPKQQPRKEEPVEEEYKEQASSSYIG